VEANRDRVAVTRGPLVYCAEEIDNPGGKVQRFFLPEAAEASEATWEELGASPLQGVVRLHVPGMEVFGEGSGETMISMVPYYAWNNRGEASMIVWMPRTEDLARESMKSRLQARTRLGKVSATHTYDKDTIAAVIDGKIPESSADPASPRWTSRPYASRQQEITIEFREERTVSGVSVFWSEDQGEDAEVKLPREWWVEYRKGDGPWERMKAYVTDFYGLNPDGFNQVRPEAALACDALRICILPQAGRCMGIHQIEVAF
jgi:hypothetical protein